MVRVAVALVVVLSLGIGCAGARSAPTTPASAPAPPVPLRRSASATPDPRACPARLRAAVVARVNEARLAAALQPLASDAGLGRAAQSRARSMAAANRLSHTGWEAVVRRQGDAPTIAENVAYDYSSADAVVSAWLRSPGHRANMLGRSFRRIGVGCVVDARAHLWWAEDLAD